VFLGAFLLFAVQPLIAKFILPWFGGAPAVWATCLVFFQVLLLAGYLYAHGSTRLLRPRIQAGVQVALIAAALLTLPIVPNPRWTSANGGAPSSAILVLLTWCLGLPVLVLASSSPLLQAWYSRLAPGQSPYRLYAVSNLGSLLALISYPLVFEPWLGRSAQATAWGWGLGIYGLALTLCAWCAGKDAGAERPLNQQPGTPDSSGRTAVPAAPCRMNPAPRARGGSWPQGATMPLPANRAPGDGETRATWGIRLGWLTLPGCASVLLLAFTHKLCRDVAVLPFLWVLPLALYLLSFVICFDQARWYRRGWTGLAFALSLAVVCGLFFQGRNLPVWFQVGSHAFALFAACLLCHGELARLKPPAALVTSYYLAIAVGGAAGGVLVTIVAPLVFAGYYELHLGLWACVALALAAVVTDSRSRFYYRRAAKVRIVALLVLAALAVVLAAAVWFERLEVRLTRRTFFGVHQLYEYERTDPARHFLLLQHDRTTHGLQFVRADKRRLPTTYYGEESGAGLVMRLRPPGQNWHIGLIGLGAGTLAAYGQPGDRYRAYEIDREVQRLAQTEFTYLADCPAPVACVIGDARRSLASEPAQGFDCLFLDAFSSDSIPVHLLTQEAFALYARHLGPDGVLAVHVSNQHLDLAPVVIRLATEQGWEAVCIDDQPDASQQSDRGVYPSRWVLVGRKGPALEPARLRERACQVAPGPLWTDEKNNLFEVLR
jgi:predicted O-methyltransferase YrrM